MDTPTRRSTAPGPVTPRVALRRGTARGDYDPTTIRSILADGLIAHVGVDTPDGPLVLPMAYGTGTSRAGEEVLYLHGALANGLLAAADGREVCVTVTIVDGLVIARTPLHNSMNYRSVVIRGTARLVTDPDEHREALRSITDHVVANWEDGRPPSARDLRKTLVVAVPTDEASAKVRTGDPVDEPADVAGGHWAGTVPLVATWGTPVASTDLRSSAVRPSSRITALTGTCVEGRSDAQDSA
ncbi:MAG: pyridoxamine 5'-phosphate oxidase family protein [Microthrixaceae bacterium]